MFKKTGYNTKLMSLNKPRSNSEHILRKINNAVVSIRPSDFLYGDFEQVFFSHNLNFENNKLKLIK